MFFYYSKLTKKITFPSVLLGDAQIQSMESYELG